MTVSQRPYFGILGGLGPLAGARFHLSLMQAAAARGARLDTDFPAVLISSAVTAGLSNLGDASADFLSDTQEAINTLVNAGVTHLVPVCNTLDAYLTELHIPENVTYVSAVQAAATAVPQDASCIGVLTSARSREAGLYTAAMPDRTVIYSSKQNEVDAAIAAGMAGRTLDQALFPLIVELQRAGAEHVLLGCTELHLLREFPGVTDSVTALVEHVLGGTQ